MDKMREAFEFWIRTDKRFRFDDISLDRCEDGYYSECRAEEMWISWRSALQFRKAEPRSPKGIQKSKLEFLKARSDYVGDREEWVLRVSFEGYQHCYLDRFGRVLWLRESNESALQPKREDNTVRDLEYTHARDRYPTEADADYKGEVWFYLEETYSPPQLVDYRVVRAKRYMGMWARTGHQPAPEVPGVDCE